MPALEAEAGHTGNYGMFTKAAMNSGGGVHKLMNSNATTKDRFEFWEKVMQDCGCKNVAELRAIGAEKLFVILLKTEIQMATASQTGIRRLQASRR
ncbi:MAG: hypothetical protein IKW08_01385 [Roseburia sp.]|nr:hypothetical protein [Roseburia sp.]